ncbi:MAG TPA: transposase [Anaerolineales bacterium]|nr:transposase [Anaerolineales bacterium]
MVTGATLGRRHIFMSTEAREFLCETLFTQAERYGWALEAWSVLSNHYHFIGRSPEDASTLKLLVQGLHSISARRLNLSDRKPGRRVWQNYWDTCIDHKSAYLARLRYVHENPAWHGLVAKAEDYPFCSFRWFVESTPSALREQVLSAPIDRLEVKDDY